MAHRLTLWTNDPAVAGQADGAGIDRIGLDLETRGKAKRQKGLATWISPHRPDDLDRLAACIDRSALFVRCDPVGETSRAEIDRLVQSGVRVLMLPNFTTCDEVARFAELVAGRARIVPLVERLEARATIARLPEFGIEEFHVGLNDLSIDLNQPNRLAVLALPVMDEIADAARAAGLAFGVGGLARAGDTGLPVPSDLVYAQQARLGSSAALIARSFFREPMPPGAMAREILAMRMRLDEWKAMPPCRLERARHDLLQAVGAL